MRLSNYLPLKNHDKEFNAVGGWGGGGDLWNTFHIKIKRKKNDKRRQNNGKAEPKPENTKALNKGLLASYYRHIILYVSITANSIS